MKDTSIEAYYSIIHDLNKKQKAVFNIIRKLHPCTDLQISDYSGIPINAVTPRRGELEKMGLIRSNEKVIQRTGRRAWNWIAKEPKNEQLNLF
jgi:DNA-binding MarR family transcriptional regulator